MSFDEPFREALKDYEDKQYQKSLKQLEAYLKRNPNHGPSYALKALVLISIDPKNQLESNKSIAIGVKLDPLNPILCHITALYYRSVKDFSKASHFYTSALKNGSKNMGITKDLSSCLSQIRDYKPLIETRFDYLQDQPGYRANWTSTAVANDLNKDYTNALSILDKINNIMSDKLIDDDLYENSECLIYKATLLIKNNELDKALTYINELLNDRTKNFDVLGLLELKAGLLLKLNKFNDAQLVYRTLLKRNPDDINYYVGLEKSLKIENDFEKKLTLYKKLAIFYPKSDLPKFLPLTFVKDNDKLFEKLAGDYIINLLKRGIPSTFTTIKPLYKKTSNIPIIFSIVKDFESNNESDLNPFTKTWIKYFFAQHYYYLEKFDESLISINEGIKITPTLVELYMFKARIFKHLDRPLDAATEMNNARLLDLQDRFVNTKSTKYYLRANQFETAIDTISLFTKNDNESNGLKDLYTMQSCWFLMELTEAYKRLYFKFYNQYKFESNELDKIKENNEINESTEINEFKLDLLKRKIFAFLGLTIQSYLLIFSVFKEYSDDQFDFHFYAFRKGTPRAYLEMIKWGDNLFHQPFFQRNYFGLMTIIENVINNKEFLLELWNQPQIKKNKKDKKEEIRWKEHLLKYCKIDDDDPTGENLVKNLIIADKFEKIIDVKNAVNGGNNLVELVPDFIGDCIIGKFMMSLSCLNKVISLDKDNKWIGFMILKLFRILKSDGHDNIKKILKMGLSRSFGNYVDKDDNELLEILNERYIKSDPIIMGLCK